MAKRGTVIAYHAVDDCPLKEDPYRPTAITFDDACQSVLSVTGSLARERVTIRRLDSRRLFAFKTSGRYLSWRMSPLGDAGYSLIRPAVRRSRQTGASVVRSLLRQR